MFSEKYKSLANPIIRYGIGIVFLLFGYDQTFNPDNWVTWIPVFNFISQSSTILILGIFNLIAGILIIIGLLTRLAALLAALHLVGVIFTIGYNDIAIRDFGLLLAAIAILLNGPDRFCIDKKLKNIRHK